MRSAVPAVTGTAAPATSLSRPPESTLWRRNAEDGPEGDTDSNGSKGRLELEYIGHIPRRTTGQPL